MYIYLCYISVYIHPAQLHLLQAYICVYITSRASMKYMEKVLESVGDVTKRSERVL